MFGTSFLIILNTNSCNYLALRGTYGLSYRLCWGLCCIAFYCFPYFLHLIT